MHTRGALTWIAVGALAIVFVLPSIAGAIILPNPIPTPGAGNCLTYGNFYVYSLQYLDNLYAKQGTPANFYVDSSPGKIADDIVIFTGSNGTPEVENPGAGAGSKPTTMDNAFSAPNKQGNTQGPGFFNMTDAFDPVKPNPYDPPVATPYFAGWQDGIWTAQIGSTAQAGTLLNFLGNNKLVFYFNLNQENSGTNPADPTGTLLTAQDMLGWFRVDLVKADGTTVDRSFYLTSYTDTRSDPNNPIPIVYPAGFSPSPIPATLDPGPVESPLASVVLSDTRWATIHGAITVNKTTGQFITFGANNALGDVINQNLGANQAAFALYNPELDAAVRGGGYAYIRISAKMAGIENGYEQFFIRPTQIGVPEPIPEPASIAVWSLFAVTGCVAAFKRRLRQKAA